MHPFYVDSDKLSTVNAGCKLLKTAESIELTDSQRIQDVDKLL
jgi:hypothetical protein